MSDTWTATVAGLTPLSEFLKMTRLFANETDINVWRIFIGAFSYLDMVIDDADRPALAARVRGMLGAGRGTDGLRAASRRGRVAAPDARDADRRARHARRRPRRTGPRPRAIPSIRGLSRLGRSRPGAAADLDSRLLRRRGALPRVQAELQVGEGSAGRAALPLFAGGFPQAAAAARDHGDDDQRRSAGPRTRPTCCSR